MKKTLWARVLNSVSDNLKSKTCGERSRTIANRKWVGIFAIALTFAMCGVVVQAQQSKKVARIGYLSNSEPARESGRAEAIRLALRELGFIEGQNIAFEYRYAEGKLDRLPELAAELVRLKVDIAVVAGGVIPLRAAKNATRRFPSLWWAPGSIPSKQA